MKYLLSGLWIITISINSLGQVGIGTDNPDPNTVLHIESTAGDKGMIIPRLTTAEMRNMVSKNPSTGTLAYNTDSLELYSYDANVGAWYSYSPFIKKMYTGSGNREGIRLSKNGSVEVLKANRVHATTITGHGTTPLGGIIMWSGWNIPFGWALCNGQQVNGYTTPDLRGRFIAGHDPKGNPAYNNVGNHSEKGSPVKQSDTGGQDVVTLKAEESGLPSHNHYMKHDHGITDPGHRHEIRANNQSGGTAWGVDDAANCKYWGEANHNGTSNHKISKTYTGITINNSTRKHTDNTGGTDQDTKWDAAYPHENRPPYYVLAFIMRVM